MGNFYYNNYSPNILFFVYKYTKPKIKLFTVCPAKL